LVWALTSTTTLQELNPEHLQKTIIGREIIKKTLLARFLVEFEMRLKKIEFEHVIPEWKNNTVT
jgi:hypothetical protein